MYVRSSLLIDLRCYFTYYGKVMFIFGCDLVIILCDLPLVDNVLAEHCSKHVPATADYERTFAKMIRSGANTAKIWKKGNTI